MKCYLVDVQWNNNKRGCVQVMASNPTDAHITAYAENNIKNACVNSELNLKTRETTAVKY